MRLRLIAVFVKALILAATLARSRWWFGPTYRTEPIVMDGHCADVDAPSHGKPQHGPRGADPHPHL